MRTTMPWPFPAVPLLAVLVLTSCGDGTAPVIEGTFEASVSGAVSADFSGAAEFGIHAGEGFGLVLLPDTPLTLLGIGHAAESRPAVGTYPVGRPDEEGAFFGLLIHQTSQGAMSFISESGEFTVSVSTPSRLAGSFEFSAVAATPSGTEDVWIVGTFEASCARAARCD
jgi:hypothetical protein